MTGPRVQQLLQRYVRAWQLADIDAFARLVTEDVRFIMPPLTAWFDGREAVAAFVENAIFAPVRPHGVQLRAGFCNGKPAFGTYEPDGEGRLVVSGLQVLQVGEAGGQPLITTLGMATDAPNSAGAWSRGVRLRYVINPDLDLGPQSRSVRGGSCALRHRRLSRTERADPARRGYRPFRVL
jgi:hypothetical protein